MALPKRAAPQRAQLPALPPPPPAPPPATARPTRSELGDAFLLNPIGPVVGTIVGLIPTGFQQGATFINLRVHHALTKRVGVTVVTTYGRAHFLFDYEMIGVKVGPRISISRPGLRGWYLSPMAIGGWGWVRNRWKKVLASGLVIGTGLEVGYTWSWRGFVLEMGTGLYYSKFLVDDSIATSGGDAGGLKPILNTSVGVGW